ncbi:DUF4340 domain-containing protein [candidate division KSB1 bacterium]|nr:MAG: DUF4340 domain-containing protein [candidate division KSB1 bacterium]
MKRSLVLLVVLVVLLGIYWLVQSKRPIVSAARPFVECDSAKVDFLRIQTAADTVEMRKEGEQWTVTYPLKYPAAQKTVTAAVGKFREMEKLTLITKNTSRHGEFQVDDALGVKVTVGQGKKTTTIYIGRSGPTGQTSYARADGTNDVWEIGGSQSATFKRKVKDWRDKTITELNQADFRKIVLEYPDHKITLTLNDSLWDVDAGKEKFVGTKDLVGRLTGMLSRMSGVDFADTLAPNAFNASVFHLQAELNDGQSVDLRLIPKDPEGNQFFLRKAGAQADYVIYKSTAGALMKKAEDFREKPETASPDSPAKAKAKA